MSLTTVLIPAARNPQGDLLDVQFRTMLVGADGKRLKALHVDNSAPIKTVHSGTVAVSDDPYALQLYPQAELVVPGGVQCWWELWLQPADGREADNYRLSVPVSEDAQSITDLVAAMELSADPTQDLLDRIAALEANQLPAPGTPGRILVDDGTQWVSQTLEL